jgi:hypothetical protein
MDILQEPASASQNFIIYFLHNKAAKKFKNYRRMYKKYWFDF